MPKHESRSTAPHASADAPVLLGDHLRAAGVSRRAFVGFCGKLMVAAPFMLAITEKLNAEEVADDLVKAERPSVIWLHFQDCTGCSESLLRTAEPDLATLITQVISLDYHETLMAASGRQAEAALHDAMTRHHGRYVLVVEGSVPTKEQGIYMQLAGRNALDVLAVTAAGAAAVIAMGSCASFGGLPAVGPNPTGATGVDSLVRDKPIVNIPGCPPNPYTLLGVVLQYARHGTLPALDDSRRPLFAYDRVIHEHCPRRAHFDAGRFAEQFGDEGHQQGWCLYKLGCKGPETHAPCSTRHFNDVIDAWPIGIGAPCVGCTEKSLAFRVPMFEKIPVKRVTPPDLYPRTLAPVGSIGAVSAGFLGLGLGAAAVAVGRVSKAFSTRLDDESVPGSGAPAVAEEPAVLPIDSAHHHDPKGPGGAGGAA